MIPRLAEIERELEAIRVNQRELATRRLVLLNEAEQIRIDADRDLVTVVWARYPPARRHVVDRVLPTILVVRGEGSPYEMRYMRRTGRMVGGHGFAVPEIDVEATMRKKEEERT